MAVRYVDNPPRQVQRFSPLPGSGVSSEAGRLITGGDVERIAEIFNTPLRGSYTWDYETADQRLRRLYSLGKELNWNSDVALDWTTTFPKTNPPAPPEGNPLLDYAPYVALPPEKQLAFGWDEHAWLLSQFLHGEQGALLVASQLVSCAPTHDAKLYAASQTFDEARHVEVFGRYLREKIGVMWPVNRNLKLLLDKVLTDERWDLKFIGMQIIIEGLALAAFKTMQMFASDPLLRNLLEYVIRDESRHVAFGVTYLEEFVKTLSQEEREDRAQFAYEACIVMRERIIATDVHEHWGWDGDATRKHILSSDVMGQFRKFLFTRIIPNLKRIGLLTDKIRPKFAEMDILDYEDLVDDGVIDWGELGAKYAAE